MNFILIILFHIPQYAANPGRFLISEVRQNDENDTKSVSIKATYPFGTVDIESIEVKPLNASESSTEPKTKTSAPTKVIKTTTVSEVAAIGNECNIFIFDEIFDSMVFFSF